MTNEKEQPILETPLFQSIMQSAAILAAGQIQALTTALKDTDHIFTENSKIAFVQDYSLIFFYENLQAITNRCKDLEGFINEGKKNERKHE